MEFCKSLTNYFKEFHKNVDFEELSNASIQGSYIFHSEDLWGITTGSLSNRFSLDENCVLVTLYHAPILKQYNPAYIAYYGLINYNKFLETKKNIYIDRFSSSLQWVKDNSITDHFDTTPCQKWTYNFDWQNGEYTLKSGWVSAMAQGLIASLLLRGYIYFNDNNFLIMAKESINLFKVDIELGGVKAHYKNYVYYEEYPAYPLSMVLDGALFSLVGVYELSKIDKTYVPLLQDGLHFIQDNFNIWNFYNVWTKYGKFNNLQLLSTCSYHRLNLILLKFFISKNLLSIKKISYFSPALLSIINLFILLKNKFKR